LGAVAVSGCQTRPVTGQAEADAQTRAACRQRAEQIYETQNRGAIYGAPMQVNTPQSGNYTPVVTDRGLADLFANNRLIDDCIRNTGTGAEVSQPAGNPTTPKGN
jgi:hypothetical protein